MSNNSRICCSKHDDFVRHKLEILPRSADAASYAELPENEKFDFVWAHPPYWRQQLYTLERGDLSRTGTLDGFLTGYAAFIRNCAARLTDGGKFVILMGDYSVRSAGFVSLTYHQAPRRGRRAAPALHRHHPVQSRRIEWKEILPLQLHSRPA